MIANGGVFFNLKLPSRTVINDLDSQLIDKYKKQLNQSQSELTIIDPPDQKHLELNGINSKLVI